MILELGGHAHSVLMTSESDADTDKKRNSHKLPGVSWLALVVQGEVCPLRHHVPLSQALHKGCEKREGTQADEESSSFLYRMTEADFMVVWWWSFSCFLKDLVFPFPVLGKSVCSWGVTRFHQCPGLRVEATDQAVPSTRLCIHAILHPF